MLTNLSKIRRKSAVVAAIVLAGSIFAQLPAPSVSMASGAAYTDLVNHDFETGDLRGWKVESGDAFAAADVTTDTDYWGGQFSQSGNYHLWGYKEGGDDQTGVLSSGLFTLGGEGKIDFLIAGGNNIDNLYVALVRASDGAVLFKATGSENEQYTRVYWDAANYIGENLYIKVVDNARGGWAHVSIDDVNVHVQPKELFNHSFDSFPYQDLRGWTTVSGTAFTNLDVTTDTTWWNGTFNQDGARHLWGYKDGRDDQVGVLKSENFVLSGNGAVDFLTSGGNNIDNLYVALTRASDGEELFKATGSNSETYTRVQWDAQQYVGEELYIKVVDNAMGDWGHINLDDVNVQIQSGVISSDKEAPSTPTNLFVSRNYGGYISLSWTPSTDNVGVYGYMININGNEYLYNNTSPFFGTSSVKGGIYSFKVRAIDHAGNLSAYSNTASAYAQ